MNKKERETLLKTLHARFEKHMSRHKGVAWSDVLKRLEANPAKMDALGAMESTGGEPDVVAHDKKSGAFTFFDCAAESPTGRRSLCYDREGLESRKAHPPADTAIDMATAMGIQLLTEAEYRALQLLGEFDSKTSSWLATPERIRKLGGAIFGDRRFDTVFVYHNGAQSYYGGRAFRGSLTV